MNVCKNDKISIYRHVNILHTLEETTQPNWFPILILHYVKRFQHLVQVIKQQIVK